MQSKQGWCRVLRAKGVSRAPRVRADARVRQEAETVVEAGS